MYGNAYGLMGIPAGPAVQGLEQQRAERSRFPDTVRAIQAARREYEKETKYDGDSLAPGDVFKTYAPYIKAENPPDLTGFGNGSFGGGNRFLGQEPAQLTVAPQSSGMDIAADYIEGKRGTLEDVPGWFNAKQFAKAGRAWADAQPGGATEDSYRKSNFLLSPQQREYMQGTGRRVDLLRDLADGNGSKALEYWEKSEGQDLARNDYSDPNYSRFSGFGPDAAALLGDPNSITMRSMENMALFPNSLLNAADSGSVGTGLHSAGARRSLIGRYRLNENPVLDIPERVPGETEEQAAERYAQRMGEVQGVAEDLGTTPGGDSFRAITGVEPSPFVGDLWAAVVDAVDPTLGASAGAGVWAKGLANRAAAGQAARIAGFAPVRRDAAGLLGHALRAAPGQLREEATGEAVFGGPLRALQGIGVPRTWADYFLSRRDRSPEEFAAEQAAREQARQAAANKVNAWERSNPNNIWQERQLMSPSREQWDPYGDKKLSPFSTGDLPY